MKRFTYLFSLTMAAFALAAVGFIGCEGPAGPAGAAGADGSDGADGTDGVDANATCTQCHDESTDIYVKRLQAANSKHLTGGDFERSDAECAGCHTHEGFLERMEAGNFLATADVANPSPQNCRTCHKIHINYDASDFAIRYPDPVTLALNDVTIDIAEGNVCANCHQPNFPDPMYTIGGDSISITNKRWGPHHGPQSAMLWGTTAYEVAGSINYPDPGSKMHAQVGCTECHMPDAYGNQAGGHTLNMTYEYHGGDEAWVAGCTSCHTGIEDFDLNGVQTQVSTLLDSLHHVLMGEGLLDADGYLVATTSAPLKVSPEEAGLLYNFKFVEEDLSMGVHNSAYSIALLKNSLEYVAAN
jgi:hypothetical protein